MKTKKYTRQQIMNGCQRTQSDLMVEIKNRIDHCCLQTDGGYTFCAESPEDMDIMRMVTRLVNRQVNHQPKKNRKEATGDSGE